MRYVYAFALILGLFFAIAHADASIAFDKLRASTVHIDMGTGSIVQGRSGKKYLLTNWHVCNPSEFEGKIQAAFENGHAVRGDIVKVNELSDLCAVALDDQSLPALKVSPSAPRGALHSRGYPNGVLSESTGKILEASMFYDYPFDIGDVGACPKYFKPLYAPGSKRLRGCEAHFENTLTSLYGRPGSSGSPVVNDDGDLVGVVESQMVGQGAGMVPYARVKAFLDGL